jgi:hypothetical protein
MNTSPPTKPVRVGLFGPAQSGKTTYAGVLADALRDRAWNVEVQHTDARLERSGQLIEEIRRELSRGHFPRKTRVSDTSGPAYFRISKGPHRLELEVPDPAGELFEPTPELQSHAAARERFFGQMSDCTGIVILQDFRRSATEMEESWRLSIESFLGFVRRCRLTHLLEADLLKVRIAFLFTKADLIPWFPLHRPRQADPWLDKHRGLQSLMHDVRRVCRPSFVQFGFSSNVGWNRGRPNCRTAFIPKPLGVEKDRKEHQFEPGDLIPDPRGRRARQGEQGAANPAWSSLPQFADPMQIVNQEDVDQGAADPATGLLRLPGRKAPTTDFDRFLTPWNVVEPLLWVAGVPEAEF